MKFIQKLIKRFVYWRMRGKIEEEVKNKSLSFIAPLIGVTNDKNIINCYLNYIGDSYNHTNDDKLFIRTYVEEDNFKNNNFLVTSFKDKKDNTLIYVFRRSMLVKENMLFFLKGEYSKFTDKAKKILEKTNSSMKPIFNKCPKRRKFIEDLVGMKLPENAELSSITQIEKEIYIENE